MVGGEGAGGKKLMSFESVYQQHLSWMNHAYDLAKKAGEMGEIPVGALIIDVNNHLIAEGINQKETNQDCTAHAEIITIRQACSALQRWRLDDCTLYVTLEPCAMCAGALLHSRLKTLVYAVDNEKTGAIRTVLNLPDSPASNHHLEVVAGIKERECRQLLTSWFAQLE